MGGTEWGAVASRVRGELDKRPSGRVGRPRKAWPLPTAASPTGNPHSTLSKAQPKGEPCVNMAALGPKRPAGVREGGFGRGGACARLLGPV